MTAPNPNAPRSHIAPDPKAHKPCAGCGDSISLRPEFPGHDCSEDRCVNGIHDYRGENCKPHVRYFTSLFQEICEGCATSTYGADNLVQRSGD